MTSNTLAHPTALLRKSLKAAQPHSVIISQLLHLLNLYSNGLTLSIALDHIASGRKSSSSPSSVQVAHIVEVAAPSPSVWHLSFSNGSKVAHFPDSSVTHLKVNPGVCITLATPFTDSSTYNSAYEVALKIAIKCLRHPLITRTDDNSSDDVDDMVAAETPSQSGCALPTAVSFATVALLFHLDTFPISTLQLSLPIHHYTLQKVWNDRTLTPDAVYAHVYHVDVPNCILRLQDSPCLATSQPSVNFHLSLQRSPLIHTLQPGNILLLLSPIATPTGSSFDLAATGDTVCMFSKGSADEVNSSPLPHDEIELQRATKRKKVDEDLSKSSTFISLERVLRLSEPQLQPPLVVHARLVKKPVLFQDEVDHWVFGFGCVDVKVKVHYFNMENASFLEGDEIILRGLTMNPFHQWIVDELYNISTMTAILYAPFIQTVVDGHEIRRCIDSHCKCTTCHVRVHINDITVSDDGTHLLFTLLDKPLHDTPQSILSTPWDVRVDESVFNSLPQVTNPKLFENLTSTNVLELTEIFQNDVWMMTLSCDGEKWPVARVRACASLRWGS